ncbi:MAG: ATP-binding cassette domain-containing protein, partial [Alphaproteobacteria bacterium]|nr:ATP-binding cassette domain-containing protein [Alphaproteobacteria bacterium]
GRSRYLALSSCSIDIFPGEFVCLLGPSGCGKSTLLNMLAGFEKPTQGSIEFQGVPLEGPSPERVVCFQDAMQALLPWATVAGNLNFALKMRGVPRDKWPEMVDRYLSLVDLCSYAERHPPELSGGMRQRLQIGRALAVDPKVLLMDEPFGALDAITRSQMQAELLRVWERTGKTVVFVTHDIGEALTLADRVAVMSKGPASRIKAVIDVELSRPRGRKQEGLLAAYVEQIESLMHVDELL